MVKKAGKNNQLCVDCGLYSRGCTTPFFKTDFKFEPDPTKKTIFVISEMPSPYDDDENEPYHEDSILSKYLEELMDKHDIPFENCIFSFTLRCRPPQGSKAKASQYKACANFIRQDIEKFKPDFILCLGLNPVKSIGYNQLSNNKRKILEYTTEDGTTIPAVAMNSMSLALNDKSNLKTLSKDIEFFAKLYHGKEIEDSVVKYLGGGFEKVKLNASIKEFNEFCNHVKENNLLVSFDYETNSAKPWLKDDFRITCIGLSTITPDKENQTICFQLDTADSFANEKRIETVKKFLLDKDIKKIAHYAKYECHASMRRFGVKPRGLHACTQLMHSVYAPFGTERSLKTLAHDLLGISDYETDVVKKTQGNSVAEREANWLNLDYEKDLAPYCCMDVICTQLIYFKLLEELKKQDKEHKELNLPGYVPTDYFFKLTMPVLLTLVDVERNGIGVDTEYAKKLSEELKDEEIELIKEARKLPYISRYEMDLYKKELESRSRETTTEQKKKIKEKVQFNINSTKQVSEILFGKKYYGLTKPTDRELLTNTGEISFSKETTPILIEKYKNKKDAVKLLEQRQLVKKVKDDRSRYVEGIIKRTSNTTNKIHSTFNQDVATTGRLSSSDPNLQNIKKDKRLRKMYVPDKGMKFCEADYSQLELRVLAAITKDEDLIDIYKKNKDFHAETARAIFRLSEDETPTEDQRSVGKTTNFGIVYGQTAYGLAEKLGCSQEESENMIEAVFDKFPGISDWQDMMLEFAIDHGFVYTMFGRRRYVGNIQLESSRETKSKITHAINQAINSPIQGTGTDMCVVSARKVNNMFKRNKKWKASIINTVHDSIMFQAPENDVLNIGKKVKSVMESEPLNWIGDQWHDIPIKIDLKIGDNWSTMEEVEV